MARKTSSSRQHKRLEKKQDPPKTSSATKASRRPISQAGPQLAPTSVESKMNLESLSYCLRVTSDSNNSDAANASHHKGMVGSQHPPDCNCWRRKTGIFLPPSPNPEFEDEEDDKA